MEKQIKNLTLGNSSSFVRLCLTGVLAASFSLVQAQDTTAKPPAAEIRYAGSMNDKLLFGVEYENAAAEPFTVEVKDGDGYVFFNNRFKDKKFRKFFAIDKSELENANASITIQLATKSGVDKQVFDISTTSRLVQEVSVVKL